MDRQWLSAAQAAGRLGIERSSLYDWLAQSNRGDFVIRGKSTTIAYSQSGAKGQGRILIDAAEVERLLQLMMVAPRVKAPRQTRQRPADLRHITTQLGKPGD